MEKSVSGNVRFPYLSFPANFGLGEKFLFAYFIYTALLACIYSEPALHRLLAWMLPIGFWLVAVIETRWSRRWSRVVRNIGSLGFIPVAYWQADWVAFVGTERWQNTWVTWDRLLLDRLGVRATLEAFGALIPSLLEASYLLLYCIPVFCVAALYLGGNANRVHSFLATLYFGTLTAYALLPYFPTVSPQLAFQNRDLPHYGGLCRSMNIWMLSHYDIKSSVFPSGHVAVAFSSAFGLLRAVPERRWLWRGSFVAASLVFIATVYSRYHYCADGLASIGISALTWRVMGAMDRSELISRNTGTDPSSEVMLITGS
jgi:hypothetical protein